MRVACWMGWVVFAAVANAQQARVCVVDATGQPLQGATVIVRTERDLPATLDASACANVPAGSAVVATM